MLMLPGIMFLSSCDFSIDDLSDFSFDSLFNTKTSVSDFIDKYDDKAYSKFININKKGSVLGRGYDIINSDYFSVDGIKSGKIIDEQKMENLSFEMIESGNSSYYSSYGETLQQLNESFNLSLGIGASYGMFSGGLSTKYNASSTSKYANAYGLMEYIVNAFRINMNNTYSEIRECLTDEFYNDLTNEKFEPKKLFEKYGTHMIRNAIMGGRIESFYVFTSMDNKFSTETSFKLEVGFKKLTFSADGSAEFQFNNMMSESNISEQFSARCYSGTNNLIDVSNYSQICANLPQWVDNFAKDVSCSSFCGVSSISDSLIPLWELLPDDEAHFKRKQNLITEFNSSLGKSKANMKYIDENTEFRVRWYDYNGNELTGSKYFETYKKSDKITKFPDAPKRDGYIFIGWYKDNNLSIDSLCMELDGNKGELNLYAMYIRNEYLLDVPSLNHGPYVNTHIDYIVRSGSIGFKNEDGYVNYFEILKKMENYGNKYKIKFIVESDKQNIIETNTIFPIISTSDSSSSASFYSCFEVILGTKNNKVSILETSPKMGYVSVEIADNKSGSEMSSQLLGRFESKYYNVSDYSFFDDREIRLNYYEKVSTDLHQTCRCYCDGAGFTVKMIITSY